MRVSRRRFLALAGSGAGANHAEGEVLLYEVLMGDPFEVKFVTIDGIVGKLRDKAGRTPAGTWVEGYFFDDTKISDKRQLNLHDLDQVSR